MMPLAKIVRIFSTRSYSRNYHTIRTTRCREFNADWKTDMCNLRKFACHRYSFCQRLSLT